MTLIVGGLMTAILGTALFLAFYPRPDAIAIVIFLFPPFILAISVYFIFKPVAYVDEIFRGAQQLTRTPELPIVLSDDLKQVQDDLNGVRERFIRERRRAELSEQRKNDLIVYLAHDLKTPLTSVIGYLSLLDEAADLPIDKRAQYTGIALDKAYRLETLINEFFEITRFNLTALELTVSTIDISRLLGQIMSEFMPIMSEKSLRWQADIGKNLTMEGDANLLERVLDNLIRNAIAYSYAHSALVLTAHADASRLVITLTNAGATIPPEKLSRLFEQFFRMDSSRSTATGGSGLGLAIAREIAERHHGRISASSADEHISFKLELPLHQPGQTEHSAEKRIEI